MCQHVLVRLLLLLALLPAAPLAWAQSRGTKPIYPITFEPDRTTTLVEGTVTQPSTRGPDMTNEGSERYSLRVRSGQQLTMEISSSNQQAMFTLIKPSAAMAKIEFVENAAGVKRWSGKLAMSGDYMVVVFTRGAEASSRFKLRVTLQ
jgi:hypothetical protein